VSETGLLAGANGAVEDVECDRRFQTAFEYLTEHRPYEWQTELFRSLVSGQIPNLSLPTGSGKTNAIVCWLLALCLNSKLPRRLVYVVDRRSVVDQSTKVVEDIAAKLAVESPLIFDVRNALIPMAGGEELLGISTLRGEFQDNQEWSKFPFRPAVLCGTVDMVGSRLLFSGYGDRAYSRSLHAGLLGNDTLVIFDECHLVPEFGNLLRLVQNAGGKLKPFHYMLMSATSNGSASIHLSHNDLKGSILGKRLRGAKKLHIVKAEKQILDQMRTLAENDPALRTIVFVRVPQDGAKIAAWLRKKYMNVVTLTGTMRGKERDELVSNPIFQTFTVEQEPAEPHFLVATSAGEVGIDLTCSRMLTDLSSAASLVQRFGRCNRFGETNGEIYLVYNDRSIDKSIRGQEYLRALNFFKTLDGDVSCLNLWNHREELAALAPDTVAVQSLPPHLLHVLSMTSLQRTQNIAAYLRGLEEDTSYVEIAWRKEVNLLAKMAPSDFDTYMKKMRVLSFEQLSETTIRAFDVVDEILEKQGDATVIVIRPNGERQVTMLSGLRQIETRNCLLILPPDRGGLSGGMFSPENADNVELDIAEIAHKHHKPRLRYFTAEGEKIEVERGWEIVFNAKIDGTRIAVGKQKETRTKSYALLRDHNQAVAAAAKRFAERAGLDADIVDALECAGQFHDEGKASPIWQGAAEEDGSVEVPIAKTTQLNTWRLGGYRHEFGSLIAANGESGLVQHLIASHHAGGRPTWLGEKGSSPIRQNPETVLEQVLRFADLQHRYGWWGLAYLEAILRSADAYVSADE